MSNFENVTLILTKCLNFCQKVAIWMILLFSTKGHYSEKYLDFMEKRTCVMLLEKAVK